MTSRGFNKLPPPGMKSDCCTGDLLTKVGLGFAADEDDVLLVVVDEGTTTVVDRLTSMFKGCSTVDLLVDDAPEGFSSVAAAAAALAALAAVIILFFLLIDSTTSFIDILPD